MKAMKSIEMAMHIVSEMLESMDRNAAEHNSRRLSQELATASVKSPQPETSPERRCSYNILSRWLSNLAPISDLVLHSRSQT